MDQQSSTSTVTVEYFDPHNVYRLLTPTLVPRLPLRNLHWQSHAGPLRSIDTLRVELVPGDPDATATTPPPAASNSETQQRDDGFQTQQVGGQAARSEVPDIQAPAKAAGGQRRHQIPGLRRTPYLKVLLVRCDDNESYKTTVRSEVREWIKMHTPPSSSSKRGSNQEKHDAFEWLIVHVVIPNTAAATQPRTGKQSDSAATEKSSTASRWRTGSTPLFEKFRSDFNSSSKSAPDRIAQVRIGINDVPYDQLPRVVPAVPSGYSETDLDAENAWADLVSKFKSLILSSFDRRVTQYEEDIREKDGQRSLPGWNFCTFFILKEGLARGFESVGLIEDALVIYDQLGVGLESVIQEQALTGSPESHGGAMLTHTAELKAAVGRAMEALATDQGYSEAEDLQSGGPAPDRLDDVVISPTNKAYRDMILENKVSVFDFCCYIFARQISLLLRLGNAWLTREELRAKLKAQRESVLHGGAPTMPHDAPSDEGENLAMLAEICRRTLEFIPSISQVMRQDIYVAFLESKEYSSDKSALSEVVDNVVSSFVFSVAQQVLAQTATKALPIPSSALDTSKGSDARSSIPEPSDATHPSRRSSLRVQTLGNRASSPMGFPDAGRPTSTLDNDSYTSTFLKNGMEELAGRRAELYMVSRSVLDGLGKKRGWHDGWADAPVVMCNVEDLEEVNLDEEKDSIHNAAEKSREAFPEPVACKAGIGSQILRTAINSSDDFYRLYEILTDKSLRHFTVAGHEHAVQSCMADLAVVKFHTKHLAVAAKYLQHTTTFFGERGWSLLELSMLAMYLACLDELQSRDEYIRVAVKLLASTCAAEKERLEGHSAPLSKAPKAGAVDSGLVKGVVDKVLSLTRTLPSRTELPLTDFFTRVGLTDAPQYHQGRDSCSLGVELHGLLPTDFPVESATLTLATIDGGPCKQVLFEKRGEITLTPGVNKISLDCSSVVPARYRISQLSLQSHNVVLSHDMEANDGGWKRAEIFKLSDIRLFQRARVLDVRMVASKQTCLDKNNWLELELSTGWNALQRCEIGIRPATGGLRLLTREAKLVACGVEVAKTSEAGVFCLGPLDQDVEVRLRFPYSLEQDMPEVWVRVEVRYVSKAGDEYFLAKSVSAAVALALGVNVQDVFKHEALFSRFTVSTAKASPLRLYGSELVDSELFEARFGTAPGSTVTIFPKQAATLLYKVTRKAGAAGRGKRSRTMYMKLCYSVLQCEVEELFARSVGQEMEGGALQAFGKVAVAAVRAQVTQSMQSHDLERAALLGVVSTAMLEGVDWRPWFDGLGRVDGTGEEAAPALADMLETWRRKTPTIGLASGAAQPFASRLPGDDNRLGQEAVQRCTIVIPVEIPSLPVVHTADIVLSSPAAQPCVNAALEATLELKWTRQWDTEPPEQQRPRVFWYDVGAPPDVWIIGGRRRGRFVVPNSSLASPGSACCTSTIPLVLIPQRDGPLAYPSVDVRQVVQGSAEVQPAELDARNLGESVRVVAARRGVTVSLDASGPGGGPLVLDAET
ncbi:hypothetical protein CDD81_5876 [Ophiocordyceps australis]|uniref:Trafficking protein particle complex subunit 10 n=1 Tax=Ophiocordyceps australis TaxID=1399860 RepID=A0A2C5YID5_9HYPO|nr:hypothetical protein CDD81_5876 [Ophiocordyceps australis]